MNYGLILAGGVGQRMRSSGMPKQFLKVFGKPIIVYTLEKFEMCQDIDEVVIACNSAWIDHMERLVQEYNLKIAADARDRLRARPQGKLTDEEVPTQMEEEYRRGAFA